MNRGIDPIEVWIKCSVPLIRAPRQTYDVRPSRACVLCDVAQRHVAVGDKYDRMPAPSHVSRRQPLFGFSESPDARTKTERAMKFREDSAMSETALRDEFAPEAVLCAHSVVVSRAGAMVVLLALFTAIVFSVATLRLDAAVAKRVDSLNSYGAVRSPDGLPHGARAGRFDRSLGMYAADGAAAALCSAPSSAVRCRRCRNT